MLPEALVSIPVPPDSCRVSESKSIAIVPESVVMSRSSAVIEYLHKLELLLFHLNQELLISCCAS